MKVTKVEYSDEGPYWDWDIRIWFEHGGVEWFKYMCQEPSRDQIKELLNSIIEDTIARTDRL